MDKQNYRRALGCIAPLFSICVAQLSAAQVVTFELAGQETVQQRLAQYKGNDSKRELALKQMFMDVGCTGDQLSEQAVPKKKQPNVLCVLSGTTADVILVGGHFDHVNNGEGVADNWSGASLLPSLYQALANKPREHTFVFIGFTGEEDGLLGSEFYVSHLSAEQLGKIELMVNLDTLGLGPTKVWVKQSDPVMLSRLAKVAAATRLPVTSAEIGSLGESDEEPFIARKVCTLVVHSLTSKTLPVLHSALDNQHSIQFPEYYDTYRLLAAFLARADEPSVPQRHACAAEPVEMYRRAHHLAAP